MCSAWNTTWPIGSGARSIDATDVYTTDAEIAYDGLCTLEDDLHYFPVYTAVFLYRMELENRAPRLLLQWPNSMDKYPNPK